MVERESASKSEQGSTEDVLRRLRPITEDGRRSAQAALLARMFGERPKSIGRYELRERLGQGGFGVVHVAWDPELRREVAIKLLRTDGEGSTGHAEQLLAEARIAGNLSHPNIVAIHDVGRFDGGVEGSDAPEDGVFVVMELVTGQTLGQWLGLERSVSQIVEVIVQAGRGLAAAHAAGVAHRDFKPSNVLIDDSGRVRVADFGLAGFVHELHEAESEDIVEDEQTVRTVRGGVRLVGTLPYMAPEQLAGALAGPASDQYALCLTLREALEGRRVFEGDLQEQRRAKRGGPPRWRGRRGVSHRVRAIVDRGLAADPDDRWPDVDALLQALERSQRPSGAHRGGLLAFGSAGLALGLWGLLRAPDSSCEESVRSMDEVWSPDAWVRVQASLLATEAPHAERTAELVVAGLDDLSARWATEQQATCEQARVEPTVAAAPLSCLARIRGQFGQAVEVFSHADREVLDTATMLVAGLPSPERCEVEEPSGAVSAAEQDMSNRLARADVLVSAGRFEDAKRIIEAVEVDAERLGARSLVASARSSEGSMLAKQGRFEEAEERLRGALELSLEIDAPEVAAQSSATLSYLLGGELARADEALMVASVATALGRGLGPSHPVHAASLYARGIVQRHAGNLEQSETDHRRALEIRRRIHPPEHPAVLDSMATLSIALASQERDEEARALMAEALEIRRRLQGDEHPDVAVSEVSLGAMLTNLDRFDEAHAVLAHAVDVLRRTLGPAHPDHATALQNLAAVEHLRGNSEAALALLDQSLRIEIEAVGAEHPSVALVWSNMGAIHRARGDLDAARRDLARALEIDRKHLDPTDGRLVTRLRGLAEVEVLLGHRPEADALWAEAIEVGSAAWGAEDPRVEALARQQARTSEPAEGTESSG